MGMTEGVKPLERRSKTFSRSWVLVFALLVFVITFRNSWYGDWYPSAINCSGEEKNLTTRPLWLAATDSPVFPTCSEFEKSVVKQNFPAKAISRETHCPDQTWFDDYLYSTFFPVEYDGKRTLVSIFLGCNKGDDAVQTLKSLSGNAAVSVGDYRKKFYQTAVQEQADAMVTDRACGSHTLAEDHILAEPEFHPFVRRFGKMVEHVVVHCVEAMPITASTLQRTTAQFPDWNQHFIVTNAAADKADGTILFPNLEAKVGAEQFGLSSCDAGLPSWLKAECQQVKAYSADSYLREQVVANNPQLAGAVQADEVHYNNIDWDRQNEQSAPGLHYRPAFVVDFLSVDVEGFDWQVLGQGGADWTLRHTRYLEFEYHKYPPWDKQLLSEAINVLKTKFGFVCYWAGRDKLVRLTDCFQEYMEIHQWSNVACANTFLAPNLAAQMEASYTRLLLKWTKQTVGDGPA